MKVKSSSGPQLPLPIGHSDKASFDNFYVGDNSELLAAIRASIELGEPKFIYFYGAAGAGKSHLLFAAAQLARGTNRNSSYLSLAAPQWRDFNDVPLAEMVDVAHVVGIDDAATWAGDLRREQALFTLFEQVKHAGGQLLIAATQAPEQAGFVLPDLVSRFNSGLIYPLKALDEGQVAQALKLRAKQRGLRITDEAARYLLTRTSRDTQQLFELLDTLDHASLVEQRRITIPFLQSILE